MKAFTIVVCIFMGCLFMGFAQRQNTAKKGESKMILRGLRTAQYHVKPSELKQARDWYARVLEVQPYFDEPFYVGFNIAGFELGLVPDADATKLGSVFVYWGVSEINSALERLVANGAKKEGEIQDIGAGIKKASVLDPFGNRFSIIENPHFGK